MGMMLPTSPGPGAAGEDKQYNAARQALVEQIRLRVRESRYFLGKSKLEDPVIAAVAAVPRHEFVPEDMRHLAYENHPLPIGHDQTISQPSLVAIMTDMLELRPDSRVLEVGTGSGYQAAILAEICASVYSIEIVEPLGRQAAALLDRLGYDNVNVRIGDGYAGWPEHAPFDGIIVTAAADEPPEPLVEQLRPGGRMVIPLRRAIGFQDLVIIEKTKDGKVSQHTVFPVMFVPFTRDDD